MEENKVLTIVLDSEYSVKVDERNLILVKTTISKGEKTLGEEVENTIGYFREWDNVFKKYLRVKSIDVSKTSRMSIAEYSKVVMDVNLMIEEIKDSLSI